MEKTIEAAFFKAFEFGGFVDSCIDYVQRKYDWGFKYSPDSKQRPLSKKWEQFYFVELPKTIKAGFEAFDSRVIETPHSPMIDEIEQNLQGCPNDVERDKYIFSLITPFARLSGIINPIAEIDRLKARISDDEKAIEYWSKENPDEQLKNTAGEAAGTPKEQIEACKAEIDRLTWQVERTREIGNNFILLLCSSQINELWTEKETVEHYLSAMLGAMEMYSNRLFAMLIQHGIDLKEYQRKAGVYLKRNWNITDVAFYVGSMELAKYYIDKLPTAMLNDEQAAFAQQSNDEQPTIKTIPLTAQQDIMTDRAKKYFEKAIEVGYMEKAGCGYKWTFPVSRGAKAALCYFIMKVYSPDPRSTNTIHYKALEKLFAVKRLDSATGAMWNAKNPQEWRGKIDSLFND